MEHFANEFWSEAQDVDGPDGFLDLAIRLFKYQSTCVPPYRSFVRLCRAENKPILGLSDIPFMPVGFFKNHKVHDLPIDPDLVFTSSGTTGSAAARHYITDAQLYKNSFLAAFKLFYGDPNEYCIMALLPGYLERSGSSLVFMIDELIRNNPHPYSGFYLDQHQALSERLVALQNHGTKTILLGVSFALLDFFERHPIRIPDITIMETGGMKGRRREMVRDELHLSIAAITGVNMVHSEYGMTELLSQAYSKADGRFRTPPWMQILVREMHSPSGPFIEETTGQVHIIDLANVHSCAFLSTQDLGKRHIDGSVEILGRMDESDLRGCNMLI